MAEKPVYRNQYRKAITDGIKRIKNSFALNYILRLSQLYARYWDDRAFPEVSENDQYRIYILNELLKDDEIDCKCLYSFFKGIQKRFLRSGNFKRNQHKKSFI